MIKKLFSLLLITALVLTMLPATSPMAGEEDYFAEGGYTGDGTIFTETSDSSFVTGAYEFQVSNYKDLQSIVGYVYEGTEVPGTAEDGSVVELTADLKAEGASKVDAITGATVVVARDITIKGNGHRIDGDGYPTFLISGGASVTIENLTIENGAYTAKLGGAMFVEEDSQLTMNNVTMRNCTANNTAIFNGGGAVYVNPHHGGESGNLPTLIANNCTFTGNSVPNGRGGAIFGSSANVTLNDCMFSNNSAAHGGAVAMEGAGTLTITGGSIQNNSASVAGGGVFVTHGQSTGKRDMTITSDIDATISSSVIKNNSAPNAADIAYGRYYGEDYEGDPTAMTLTLSAPEGNIGEAQDLTFADKALSTVAETKDLTPVTGDPAYTLTPIEDEVYQAGTTVAGIPTMTVNAGFSGLKYFGVEVAPIREHSGREAVVFTHQRDDVDFQFGLNVTKADFDTVPEAKAGFNVLSGDVITVYIVDDLTNDPDFNPTVLLAPPPEGFENLSAWANSGNGSFESLVNYVNDEDLSGVWNAAASSEMAQMMAGMFGVEVTDGASLKNMFANMASAPANDGTQICRIKFGYDYKTIDFCDEGGNVIETHLYTFVEVNDNLGMLAGEDVYVFKADDDAGALTYIAMLKPGFDEGMDEATMPAHFHFYYAATKDTLGTYKPDSVTLSGWMPTMLQMGDEFSTADKTALLECLFGIDNVFEGGSGTETDPYQIATPEQLDRVRNYLDKHFVLNNDINLDGYANWEPIGVLTWSTGVDMEAGTMDMTKVFSGSFDGNNKTISNMMAATDGDMIAVGGLFACSTGTVKDLTMENVTINGDETTLAAGGVVGYAMGGEISNVTLTGTNTVTGTNCVGGIVGGSDGADISECTVNTVDIIVIGDNDFHAADSETKGRIIQCDVAECGGLVVGGGFTGSVENCTATGTVTAEGNEPVGLGGIGGALQCMTEISGNTATVTITTTQGGHAIGGLCGYAGMGDDGSGYDQDGNYNASLRTVAPPCEISNNIVNVTINAPGATHVGGLVGTGLYFYGMEDRFNVTGGCTVTGTIIAGTDATSPYGVTTPGAVAGRAVGSNVDGCTFTGLTINGAAATNKVGATSIMYESADQYESEGDTDGGALLYGLTDTYQPLFEGAIFNEEYSDYWHDYCAVIVGEDNAADTAAAMKASVAGTLYGPEAVAAYTENPENTQFYCGFTGDVATVIFNGSQISGYNASEEELFSHAYRYVGYEISTDETRFGFYIFESLDGNADEYKYFAMAPDTPDTTHHIEFRYGSDLDELLELYGGEYAYWMAAGIPTAAMSDPEETEIEAVIALFCLENMDYTAARTSSSLSQISDMVGTWDYYIDGQAQPDMLYFVVDANGNGHTYYMGQRVSDYQVFAYDNDGSSATSSGIYVANSDELKWANYSITTNSAGKIIFTLTGEDEGQAFTISYIKRTSIMSPFAGGSGTVEDPYQIATPEQLDRVRNYLDQHFKLIEDISLSDYENWEPIGTFEPLSDAPEDAETPKPEAAFTGTFDGNSHTISNVKIDQPEGGAVGLFGCAVGTQENPSAIRNLTVKDVDVTGYAFVGGVIGVQFLNGNLERLSLTGSNTVRGNANVGGITGGSMSDMKDCDAAADIVLRGDGANHAGVLSGGLEGGSLLNCTATGTVTAEGDNRFGLGGLAGCVIEGEAVTNCHANGVTITASGANNAMIGGLLGHVGTFDADNPTQVTGCSADVAILVADSTSRVGGLVGSGFYLEEYKDYYPTPAMYRIADCETTGSITGGSEAIGSIAGHAYNSTVENCTSTLTWAGHETVGQIGYVDTSSSGGGGGGGEGQIVYVENDANTAFAAGEGTEESSYQSAAA